MAIESITNTILAEANQEAEKIIRQAQEEAVKLRQQAKQEAAVLREEIIGRERSLAEKEKQRLMVSARLESKKEILKAKQEFIDELFKKVKAQLKQDEFKKEQVFQDRTEEVPENIDFYLQNLRIKYETEIAGIITKLTD